MNVWDAKRLQPGDRLEMSPYGRLTFVAPARGRRCATTGEFLGLSSDGVWLRIRRDGRKRITHWLPVYWDRVEENT